VKLLKLLGTGTLLAAAAGALFMSLTPAANAADHLDPPNRVGTPGAPADIADLYAFTRTVDSVEKLVVVMTFAGPLDPVAGQQLTVDDDTVYEIHLDRAPVDQDPDVSIDVRFAQNALGNWGVRAIDVPGSSGPIIGNVEAELVDGEVKVFAGLREDPFFFDLQGFNETLAGGNLAFDSGRDFFAGKNVSALVIEMPVAAALGTASALDIWATTGTFN
jgi:hypothetical protein